MGIKSNDHQMIIYDIRDIRYSVWYDVRIAKIILLQWRPRLKVNWSSLKTFFSINWWFWSLFAFAARKSWKFFHYLHLNISLHSAKQNFSEDPVILRIWKIFLQGRILFWKFPLLRTASKLLKSLQSIKLSLNICLTLTM